MTEDEQSEITKVVTVLVGDPDNATSVGRNRDCLAGDTAVVLWHGREHMEDAILEQPQLGASGVVVPRVEVDPAGKPGGGPRIGVHAFAAQRDRWTSRSWHRVGRDARGGARSGCHRCDAPVGADGHDRANGSSGEHGHCHGDSGGTAAGQGAGPGFLLCDRTRSCHRHREPPACRTCAYNGKDASRCAGRCQSSTGRGCPADDSLGVATSRDPHRRPARPATGGLC